MTKVVDVLSDITQPVILLSYPLPRSISKTSAVTYNLSETLFEGEFKWIWLGGVADPSAPYTAVLTEEERQAGDHIEIELTNSPTVVENALYTLSLSGKDRAGNKAKRAYVPGLQYDFTPPELSILSPDTGSAINFKEVHFANSELLQSAQMIWIQSGGNEDPQSPHISALENDELLGKEIGPIAAPDLVQWAPGLPKTRSGKIMRRILRKIAEDDFNSLGDTSTLAEPAVVDDLIENRMNRE